MELPQHWPLPQAATLRDELEAAYADPSRHFHDRRHLEDVLTRLDELADGGARFEAVPVRLAAWFHDAVYDCERDAEERSAVWAEHALAGLVEEAVVAETARLVRLTETHDPAADDANGAALSDADLAVLASPQSRYGQYVAAVRREYAHLGEEEWRAGRADLLRGLLERERIFRTAVGHDRWEAPARRNIEAELSGMGATLTSGGR